MDRETGEERAELLAPKLSIAETSVQRACTLLPGKTSRRLAGGSSLMMPAASWIKGPRPASANGAVESRTGGRGAMLHNSMRRAAAFEVDDRQRCRSGESVYFFVACQRPSAAPVGSMIIEKMPSSITGTASLTMFAPSDFALAVAALMSSTST